MTAPLAPSHRYDTTDLSWQKLAECQYVDPDLWFPEYGTGRPKEALRICRRCPVRMECLQFAIRNDLRFGVYGGLTQQQRHELLKAKKVTR